MDNYKKLFGKLDRSDPPASLERNILSVIGSIQERSRRVRLWAYSCGALFSFLLSCWAFFDFIGNTRKTGFWQYASLASSKEVIFSYWRELALSLFESLPFFVFMVLLASVALLLWSVANVKRNIGAPSFNFNFM